MANLQKSTGRQLSRGQRESRAFRALQIGAVTGAGFAVTAVLWLAGVLSDRPPLVLAIATILCAVLSELSPVSVSPQGLGATRSEWRSRCRPRLQHQVFAEVQNGLADDRRDRKRQQRSRHTEDLVAEQQREDHQDRVDAQ